jgi:O-antigen/teichoic acid export membrane protein
MNQDTDTTDTRVVAWLDGVTYWTTRGFWAVVDQALFAVSNLIINVLLARWLSPREYGAFVTAYVVLLLIAVAHSALIVEPMLVLGPSKYAGRFGEYLKLLLRLQWKFGGLAAGALLLIGAVQYALGASDMGATFIGLACAAPFIFLSWLARRACYVERRPVMAALGGALYLFIAGVGAVLLFALGLLTSMAAQLLMGVASCAAAFLTLRLIAGPHAPATKTIDTRALWTEHWTFLRWSGAAGLLYFSQGLVFYLLLPLFSSLEASAALRAMTNFVMPILQSDGALATLIMPELARARGLQRFSRIVNWSRRLFALEGLLCWLVVAIFRHDLVRLAYGDRYSGYADLLIVLGALPLVASRVNVLGAALRALGRVQHAFWASLGAATAALVVGFSTMTTFGAFGAVSAMIVADLVRIGVMTHLLGKPDEVADGGGGATVIGPPQSARVLHVRQ